MGFSLPDIRLELLEELSPPESAGFLSLRRRRLRAVYPDGTSSEPFVYDEVDRAALDAAVILAHYRAADGAAWVYLRSALRPPLVFRDRNRKTVGSEPLGSIWELPAGLIEVEESGLDGARRAAARELKEELGFSVVEQALTLLGPSVFPCPSVIAERHFFFEVLVNPSERGIPELDGSPLERDGVVLPIALEEALALCRSGNIVDAKTELGLRRLREYLS